MVCDCKSRRAYARRCTLNFCHQCPSCPRRWFPEQEPLLPTQQACIDAIRADDHRKAVERKIALRAEAGVMNQVCQSMEVGNQSVDSP